MPLLTVSSSQQGRVSPQAPPPGGRISLTAPLRKPSAVQPTSSPASQANSQPSSQPPSQPQSAPMSPRGQSSETCNLPPPQPAEASSGPRVQMLQRTLEPVQEESGQANTIRNASVQELKEQLLAERNWWQKTSAAQVTQQVDQLRRDVETQQVTLAKIAEHLLANGAPQMQSVEASLNECRALVLQQQQAQELQANALREGLLEIHEQRAALEKEITQARERREGKEGLDEIAQPLLKSDADLQAWVTTELRKLRSEVSEANASARPKEIHEAFELHTHLAEELANAIHRFEDQRSYLSQAIEAERLARTSEVSDLRKALEDNSVQKAYIEKTIGAFLERAEQIEQKLGTSTCIRDGHNLVSDIESLSARIQAVEASKSKAEANGPPVTQVLTMIRDAQEMLRFEFAARLAELEMKVRDQGQLSPQPRADADELAQRLEAIKSQLRAEIEKRIERSPNSKPLIGDMETSPKKLAPKAPSLIASRTIA